MKLIDLTIKDFVDKVDSATPTPGGGSVSALSVVVGISLIKMVGNLTITKKKFLSLDEKIRNDFLERLDVLEKFKIRSMELIDQDTEAFNEIIKAYKLPKTTEIENRQQAISKATLYATETPFNTANIALQALRTCEPMFEYANKNTVSDFGVGAMMIHTGFNGSIMNVKINLLEFNKEIANKYYQKINEMILEAQELCKKIMNNVNKHL